MVRRKPKKYRLVGQYGQVACFSSQSYKLLNAGESGFVVTNDAKMATYCILAAGSYENSSELSWLSPNFIFNKVTIRSWTLAVGLLGQELSSYNCHNLYGVDISQSSLHIIFKTRSKKFGENK